MEIYIIIKLWREKYDPMNYALSLQNFLLNWFLKKMVVDNTETISRKIFQIEKYILLTSFLRECVLYSING